jgi:hypothetical protein
MLPNSGYVDAVKAAAANAVGQGFLLRADADALIAAAQRATCSIHDASFRCHELREAITTMTSEDVSGPSHLAPAGRLFCNRLRVRSLAHALQPSGKTASS